jgi:hypothetical protein
VFSTLSPEYFKLVICHPGEPVHHHVSTLIIALSTLTDLQHALFSGAAAGQAGGSLQLSWVVFACTLPYCMQQQ